MKKFYFAFIIIAFFLDYSFLPMVQPDLVVGANFMLIVLVCIILRQGYSQSLSWIFLGGLLLDYVSQTPLGTNVLMFLFIGIGLDAFQKKLLSSRPNTISLLIIIFSCFAVFEVVRIAVLQALHLSGMFKISGVSIQEIKYVPLLAVKIIMSFIGVFVFHLLDKIEWLIGDKFVELKVDHKNM